MVKKVSNFKQFNESNDSVKLTKEDIEEIFIDLIDEGYLFQFYNTSAWRYSANVSDLYPTNYYFDFRKQYIRQFDFNLNTSKYGCQDLDSMGKEIQKILDILKNAKQRLNSMGYDIGFEPEFAFSEDTLFCITCHMSHRSIKDEDDEY